MLGSGEGNTGERSRGAVVYVDGYNGGIVEEPKELE